MSSEQPEQFEIEDDGVECFCHVGRLSAEATMHALIERRMAARRRDLTQARTALTGGEPEFC